MIDIQEYSVPEKISWGQEMENCEACPDGCCQRHPTAAGCNIRWAVICCLSLSSVTPWMPRLLKRTSKCFGEVKAEDCVFFSNSYDHWASIQPTGSNISCQGFQRTWISTTHFRSQVVLLRISFLSGLSLALNKEGCDWQDRHSSRANSGRATHLSQTRYTPLVEVNQAIKAWSF